MREAGLKADNTTNRASWRNQLYYTGDPRWRDKPGWKTAKRVIMIRTWRSDSAAVGTFHHLQVIYEVVVGVFDVYLASLFVLDVLLVVASSSHYADRAIDFRKLLTIANASTFTHRRIAQNEKVWPHELISASIGLTQMYCWQVGVWGFHTIISFTYQHKNPFISL